MSVRPVYDKSFIHAFILFAPRRRDYKVPNEIPSFHSHTKLVRFQVKRWTIGDWLNERGVQIAGACLPRAVHLVQGQRTRPVLIPLDSLIPIYIGCNG